MLCSNSKERKQSGGSSRGINVPCTMPGKLKSLDKCYMLLFSTLLITEGFTEEVEIELNFQEW